MKTNLDMLKELEKSRLPICKKFEAEDVVDMLEISGRDELSLRNLRELVEIYYQVIYCENRLTRKKSILEVIDMYL